MKCICVLLLSAASGLLGPAACVVGTIAPDEPPISCGLFVPIVLTVCAELKRGVAEGCGTVPFFAAVFLDCNTENVVVLHPPGWLFSEHHHLTAGWVEGSLHGE